MQWPHGGRPRRPFFYADEVWCGVEHQVAAHLIYEGLVEEGLEIARAVRHRHDGYRRNPWSETEAGYHYVRSMASWALLLAYSGFRYDAIEQTIGFAPAAGADDFRCFFSTGSGWGTFAQDATGARLELLHGSLQLSRLGLRLAPGRAVQALRVGDRDVSMQVETTGEDVALDFEPVALTTGDVLHVELA